MTKQFGRNKAGSGYGSFSDCCLYAGGALVAMLVIWAFWSFVSPGTSTKTSYSATVGDALPNLGAQTDISTPEYCKPVGSTTGVDHACDPPERTFYDDPKLGYSIDKPMRNWDEKRREWLKLHPSFIVGVGNRILMVTGSQSTPCKNPVGDHVLLRCFKNKVDYCRIHGYDIFYNNVLFHPQMFTFWSKVPTIRAAMFAHPEAEWIWWVDSDAIVTDMDFKLPLERYKAHNFVVHGWLHLIYEEKSWTSINAGVFMIRNCQWSLDFMEEWASMGPQTPNYDKWGEILKTTFKDKIFPESDDQSGLVYLLLREKEKWGDKVYVEGEYYFEGYWMEIVGKLDNISDRYMEIEKKERKLRRRHAEKVSESYGKMWEEHLKDAGYGREGWRRPFITHFTGCQPCSGAHNQMYSGRNCWESIQKALNFADNQVLRNFGFVHRDLPDPSSVSPLPFDFPA